MTTSTARELTKNIFNKTVIVSALGYFVDIYDLLLFGIVRVPSLRSMGLSEPEILSQGVFLINAQMTGLLVGGILWGILGDKKGRLSVLFGSIFLYSVANIANAFVTDVNTYAALRFIAGIGLAGELGAAITLVSETMTKETRGYGTAIVASVGILGAVMGGFVADHFSWSTAYIIGGVMGLALLVLRFAVFESGMYSSLKHTNIKRGDIAMLFNSTQRFWRYAKCILIGVPLWFVIGILVTFSPEIAKELGVAEPVSAARAIMVSYAALAVGDFVSGFLSQMWKSRRKVVAAFYLLKIVAMICYFKTTGLSAESFYWICAFLGFSSGYWAVFITVAAENFGTNLRATVTTTVPNFVRGSVVPLTLAFRYLGEIWGIPTSAAVVGAMTLVIGFLALWRMNETYARDLDFTE